MNTTRAGVPGWLICVTAGWLLTNIAYSLLCARHVFTPPWWLVPVPDAISLILLVAIWRRSAARARRAARR